MVGQAGVETDLLTCNHNRVSRVTDHAGALAAVALHPGHGGEGAVEETPFRSFAHVLSSTVRRWHGTKLAAGCVSEHSPLVAELPTHHSGLLLSLTEDQNEALALGIPCIRVVHLLDHAILVLLRKVGVPPVHIVLHCR